MNTRPYILAIDQGTTSCRALAFDRNGHVVAVAQREFAQYYPQPGWVEHDASEIWRVQRDVLREAAAAVGGAEKIAGIGITNQRETAVLWDRATGEPVGPAIVWQCRRSTDICARLRADGKEAFVRERTGLLLDPYFSGTKLTWRFERDFELRRRAEAGEVLFGTIDSWLLWNLSAGRAHATDPSNASRTLLYNLHTRGWDSDLLDLFGVPAACLPEIKPSSGLLCTTDALGEGTAIPVAGIAGDQQAALFGQACHTPGMAKNTYGTGCFLLMHAGDSPRVPENGLLGTVAWEIDGKTEYAVEGSVFVAGAAIQWLRDGLGLIETAAETESLARSVDGTGGVYLVPAFTGLGTPYWKPDARGLICGLTRGTTRAHLVRAALESIAYQSRDLCEAITASSGVPLRALRVDGGATANSFLMQFQADILDLPVERPANRETTALGAAFLAGLAVGFWSSRDELASIWKPDGRFIPAMESALRDSLWSGWKQAVAYQT